MTADGTNSVSKLDEGLALVAAREKAAVEVAYYVDVGVCDSYVTRLARLSAARDGYARATAALTNWLNDNLKGTA